MIQTHTDTSNMAQASISSDAIYMSPLAYNCRSNKRPCSSNAPQVIPVQHYICDGSSISSHKPSILRRFPAFYDHKESQTPVFINENMQHYTSDHTCFHQRRLKRACDSSHPKERRAGPNRKNCCWSCTHFQQLSQKSLEIHQFCSYITTCLIEIGGDQLLDCLVIGHVRLRAWQGMSKRNRILPIQS